MATGREHSLMRSRRAVAAIPAELVDLAVGDAMAGRRPRWWALPCPA